MMDYNLDHEKLIEAAEGMIDHALVQNNIEGAAQANRPVQVFTSQDGTMYQLWVVLRPYEKQPLT